MNCDEYSLKLAQERVKSSGQILLIYTLLLIFGLNLWQCKSRISELERRIESLPQLAAPATPATADSGKEAP